MSLSNIARLKPLPQQQILQNRAATRFGASATQSGNANSTNAKSPKSHWRWVTYLTKPFRILYRAITAPINWFVDFFFPKTTKTSKQESTPVETQIAKSAPTQLSESERELHLAQQGEKLFHAIRSNDALQITALLEKIPQSERAQVIMATDADGTSLLHEAAKHRQSDMIQQLLEAVPEDQRESVAKHADSAGVTPLHWAAMYHNTKAAEVLLQAAPSDRKAMVTQADAQGNTPFSLAIDPNEPPSMVQLLLNTLPATERAELIRNTHGVMLKAARQGYINNRPETLQTLLNAVPEAERAALVKSCIWPDGYSLLGDAIYRGDVKRMHALLRPIPETMRAEVINQIPGVDRLRITCTLNKSTAEALLDLIPENQRSAFVNSTDRNGIPWIAQIAENSQSPEVLRIFLKHGGQEAIHDVDNDGNTLLHHAAGSIKPAMCQLVLAAIPTSLRSIMINQPDGGGLTPLHWAAGSRNADNIRVLLQNGAQLSISRPDELGETPLHHAVRTRELAVIQALLQHGAQASLNHVNNLGNTPLQMIAQIGQRYYDRYGRTNPRNYWVAGLLLAHGATPSAEITDFTKRTQDYLDNQCKAYITDLLHSNNYTKVRQASQWFQQFPPTSDVLNWGKLTQDCNTFLQQQSDQLKLASTEKGSRQTAIQILARCRSVLISGIPISLEKRDILLAKARDIGYIDFIRDAIVADPSYSTCSELMDVWKKNGKFPVGLQ